MIREVQYRTFVVNVGMCKTNILSCTIGQILYVNLFWRKTKFGELANHYQTAKFKFHQ